MSTTETDLTVAPYRVADDTWVIPQLVEAPPVGYVFFNSMVITGREPVVVDTGAPVHREQWLRAAWNIVDPKDVRWIFLTHDDRDHAGNLMHVLEACPKATLVTTWFMFARLHEEMDVPMNRCRWVGDGETFDAGDRTLLAVQPPFFDNPTTRGLFDERTGVYWSVDSFGANIPHAVEDAADLPQDVWEEGILLVNRLNHPWFQWMDAAKINRHIDRTASLPIDVIANCHGPAIHGPMVERAYELIRRIPSMDPYLEPTQADLELWLAAAQVSAGAEGSLA
jgi:flavorubredoxin